MRKYIEGYCRCGDYSEEIDSKTKLCKPCYCWHVQLERTTKATVAVSAGDKTVDGRCRSCNRVQCVCPPKRREQWTEAR